MGQRGATWTGGLLLASIAASCLPEDDETPSISLGFVAPSTTADEGTAGTVTVELDLRGLSELPEELSVTVADKGTGTASSGDDYTPLASTVLTFPAGSPDGTTRSVLVAALADDAFEGLDETVELELTNLVGVANLTTTDHEVVLGEVDAPIVRFTSATSATPDEASTGYTVDVELELAGGDSLDVPVSVTVSTSGVGTASAGIDYTLDGAGVLTFAAGTSATETRTLTIDVVDDGTFEGDETLVLALVDATPGALLGGSTTHTFTITDDDAPVTAALAVRVDDGGGMVPVNSGDSLDLGSQQLDAGPNAGVLLELANLGTLPLTVSPLDLAGDLSDFRIELDQPAALAPPPPVDSLFPLVEAGRDALEGVVLEQLELALDALDLTEHVVLHGVPLPAGTSVPGTHVSLRLERRDLPFDEKSEIHVDGVKRDPADLVGELSIWKGEVLGIDGSSAFLSFSAKGSRGWIRVGDGPDDVIHLVTEQGTPDGIAPSARLATEGLLDAQRTREHAGCSGVRYAPGYAGPTDHLLDETPDVGAAPSVGVTTTECRLALETDYQLFQTFGDAGDLTEYVTQLVAFTSAQYEEDVQARLTIAYLGVHTTSNDGWATPETPGADTGDMLDEFRAAWANSFPVQADLAHFLSGASLGGGIAYVGVLCSQSFGFGVSANLRGWIDWGTFDGSPDPLNWDFVVFAHELGHNFGATHTHSYCPPLDHCYGNCDGTTSCGSSTLMSYCHTCSGGLNNVQLRFHPRNADTMRARIALSCLADWEIGGGGSASFRLLFDPVTTTGAKAVSLDFTHDAPNAPSPFAIDLTGTSTP